MFTQFVSVDDFFKAVKSEKRHRDEITDTALRRACVEYRHWLRADPAYRQPFEIEFREQMERCADRYRPRAARPRDRVIVVKGIRCRKPKDPTPENRHLFELFGIDWTKPPAWRPREMHSEFKSIEEYFEAIDAAMRRSKVLTGKFDYTIWYGVSLYRLWHREWRREKSFEAAMIMSLEGKARRYGGREVQPAEAHLFDLFEIDWRAERFPPVRTKRSILPPEVGSPFSGIE